MKVVLDGNIFDQLGDDLEARNAVVRLCTSRELEVLVPHTLLRELMASPFGGVPTWFPTTVITDSVFVLDYSRLGSARLGDGEIYTAHKGESQKAADAVLADVANTDADLFVSEDRRARQRYADLTDSSRSLEYTAFRTDILGL